MLSVIDHTMVVATAVAAVCTQRNRYTCTMRVYKCRHKRTL